MRKWNQWWRRSRLSVVALACALILPIGLYGCDLDSEAEMPPQEDNLPPDEVPPDELPPDQLPPDELPPDELRPDELPPDELPPDELPPDDPIVIAAPVFGQAVFDPSGRYVLQQVEMSDGRCLAVADIDTGLVQHDGGLCGLRWIAVGSEGRAYLLAADGRTLTELDLASMGVVGTHEFTNEYRVLDLAPDGGAVVASNRPVRPFDVTQYEWRIYDMPLRFVGVVDLTKGVVHEQPFPFAIRSVAFSPLDGTVLLAAGWWQSTGLPETRVYWMNPESGVVEDEVAFPNCPAALQVQPQGTLLLMSPNVCFLHPVTLAPPPVQDEPSDEWEDEWEDWEDEEDMDEWENDPTSIIDLATREYVGKLPGFGPLALSPDGSAAVAFSRQQAMMKQWNMFQQTAHGLLFIRLDDLYWKVLEHGNEEPDFRFAPDSQDLLIHDRDGGTDRLLKMTVDAETAEELQGPPAVLAGSSFGPAGAVLYAASGGDVQRIEVAANAIQTLATPAPVAQVFARPQGDFVIAAGAESTTLYLLATDGGTFVDSIDL